MTLELITLGECELRLTGEGRRVTSVLAQKKRFAILTYLAVENPGRFVRRDLLLPLFWPDFDQPRARAALRRSLHFLRRSLGEGVLIRRGDEEIAVDSLRLRCDVTDFEKALEAGSFEGALALYRGDFLHGFHLGQAGPFEQWLDEVRLRLQEKAALAAHHLESEAEKGQDVQAAARWARRGMEVQPYDEAALRRLVVLLDRSGNRAEAARAYERFAGRLKAQIGVEPSPDTKRVVEQIRAREVPVGGQERPGAEDRRPKENTKTEGPKSERDGGEERRRPMEALAGFGWRPVVGILALLAALGSILVLWPSVSESLGESHRQTVPVVKDRVVVADFESASSDELLADVVSEALRTGLAQSQAITAVSPSTIGETLQRMRRSPDARLTPELAREVAIREEIDIVISGRVQKMGSGYVLAVNLVQAETGDVLRGWVETPSDSTELAAAIGQLAVTIREAAGESLTSREAASPVCKVLTQRVTTQSLPALLTFRRGLSAYSIADFVRAAERSEEAVALDSTFAAAYLLLASSLSIDHTSRGRELEALSRAFQLRDQLTELEQYEVEGAYYSAVGDLPRAIEAFRSLNDESEGVYGHAGTALCLLQAGDLADAEKEFRRGRDIPGAFRSDEGLIRVLHRTGRRSEAWALLEEAEQRYPLHPIFAELRREMTAAAGEHRRADSLAALVPLRCSVGLAERHSIRYRAVIHGSRGRYAEALRHLDEFRELQLTRHMLEPAINTTTYAARLLLARGDPGAANSYVERFLERAPLDSLHALSRPYVHLSVADFFVEAGRPDRARSLLEAYDSEIQPEFRRPGGARRYMVRAKLAAVENNAERTLDQLSQALRHVRVYGQSDFDLPIHVPLADRPEVARLYAHAGRKDSAVAVYKRYLANSALRRQWLDAYELAGALEHLADLHVAAGRPLEAAFRYRQLAELWDEADPDLESKAEEALRHAARLEAGTKPK